MFGRRDKRPPRQTSTWREYAEALVMAVLLAMFIRTFVVQAFKIPSGSMLPTLQIGDHLLVNKFIYGLRVPFLGRRIFDLHQPQRDDVIVFIYPQDRSKDFIKRVKALPGDIPHEIEVNVSTLVSLDVAIYVKDLSLNRDKVHVLSDADELVTQVLPPRVEEEPEVVEEAEELEGVEGEERPEVEAAPEGGETAPGEGARESESES